MARILLSSAAADITPVTGLVFNLQGDAGLVLSGSNVTSWSSTAAGANLLTPSGTPVVAPLQSGTQGVIFSGNNDSMTGPVTGLPTGAAARAVFMAVRFITGFYSGFGWGADVTDQAFTLGVDDAFFPILDFRGSRITGPVAIAGEMVVLCATGDGTGTFRLYVNNVEVGLVTGKTINTGTTQINVMRSWSGAMRDAQIGAVAVYDHLPSDTERTSIYTALASKYLTPDTTAPVITPATPSGATTTSLDIVGTVSEPVTMWYGVKTNATLLTAAAMKLGTGLTGAGSVGLLGPSYTIPVKGLTAGQTYYAHTYAEDLASPFPNPSGANGTVSASVTLPSSSVPPVVSNVAVTPTSNGGTCTWDTTQGDGTYKYLISSNATETAATIKASSTGGNVTTSGAQSFSFSGVAAGQTRYIHVCHTNTALQDGKSQVSFTTTAASSMTPTSGYDNITNVTGTGTGTLNKGVDDLIITSTGGVIGITASTSGAISLLSKDNSGKPPIYIRHWGGTYSDMNGSLVHTGTVDITGSKNIHFTRMHFRDAQVTTIGANTVNCSFSRCLFEGKALPAPADYFKQVEASWPPASSVGVVGIKGASDGIQITDCLIRMCNTGIEIQNGAKNLTLRGNVHDFNYHDDIKVSGSPAIVNLTILNWWPGRRKNARPPADPLKPPHEDVFQSQSPTGGVDGGYFRGIVYMVGENDWWQGNSGGANQGLFFGDSQTLKNLLVEECFFAHQNGTFKEPPSGHSGNEFRDSTLYCTQQVNGYPYSHLGNFSNGVNRRLYCSAEWTANYMTTNTSGGSHTCDNGGLKRDIGSAGAHDYTIVAQDFRYGIPMQNSAGTMNSPPTGVKDIEPGTVAQGKSGVLHWSGGTVGCRVRMQEIFDATQRGIWEGQRGYKLVPGNVGWPVAGTWRETYDPELYITCSHTGTYNADGDNV